LLYFELWHVNVLIRILLSFFFLYIICYKVQILLKSG